MIVLGAGDYRLELDPARGGSVTRFDWQGKALMRPASGPSIFDVASFPLVPFSNRIAHGRFRADSREVALAPNFPGSDHPHPLHGFGWLAAWDVVEASDFHAVLQHVHPAGEWPWAYRARQVFHLDESGLVLGLSVTNLSAERMPAGLGFHPYFPRDHATRYRGAHRGEWRNTAECLPLMLDTRGEARDWWEGEPVDARAVDTAYTEREGPLTIEWPLRNLALTLAPSDILGTTVVFTPAGEDYFCVEPVSHATDAHNREPEELAWLAPGESTRASVALSARALTPPLIEPLTT
ncbi:aldose 1-epimerase [Novosphingobium sp. PhB165]|uniref:aldose 1-epimerase n=1 Tax=Novosphingobium sp. PhB165 TaxID=2485105 RepID=UPI0010D74896|nr:aldose 1-epimerase [Novosphingobium sp. PhB165]TCM21707.1 aldose 1-epimerase [Novosphingobium sp. PhB165]